MTFECLLCNALPFPHPWSAFLAKWLCVHPWGEQGFVCLVFLIAEHRRSLSDLVTCTSKKEQGKPPGSDEVLLTVQCTKQAPVFPTSPNLQE